MNDKEKEMSEGSIKRGVPQKKVVYSRIPSSHTGIRKNANGQRGWDLNPLNPKRIAILKWRAREAVSEYRHAVDVYKKHQECRVKKS